MSDPRTITSIGLLQDACAHMQQFGVIEGRIAPNIIATSRFDPKAGRFVTPHTWYADDVMADVRLVDAGPDALRRLVRMCELIERVNAGGALFAFEIADLWWKAPAEVVVAEIGAAS